MDEANLHFRIDTSGGVPIYLQLIGQVKYHIANGVLEPGDELPSVRSLAERNLVNPNTVARAYMELEREGVIYKRRGRGTYVSEQKVEMTLDQKVEIIRELLEKAVIEGRQLGVSTTQLRMTLEQTLKKFPRRRL